MQRSSQLHPPRMARFCGVDGCKMGWIAILCAQDFSNVEWRVARSWTELRMEVCVVAVDMPIGLADRGRRGCDEAARARLPGRKSAIFPMPVRTAFDLPDYAAANAWSKANGHGGVVKQAWNLRSRILDLEQAILGEPQAEIYESHPELAFARLAGRALPPKKTHDGRAERLGLLTAAGISDLPAILKAVPKSLAAADDILDAAVLVLTAQRIAAGDAETLPEEPRVNAQGWPMTIRV